MEKKKGINLPKPTKKELEFIECRKICHKEIEKAFSYVVPPFKVGLKEY